MHERLPEARREVYLQPRLHVAGDPPVLVDAHPNAHAHAVIAEANLAVIEAKDAAAGSAR